MCTGCHLAPGVGDNEMRQGLYPKPPNLTERRNRSPAQSFWIIKHGLKMSGMPAWGVTHDDESIWGLVAVHPATPDLERRVATQRSRRQRVMRITITTSRPGEQDHDHNGTDHDSDGPVPATGATARPKTPRRTCTPTRGTATIDRPVTQQVAEYHPMSREAVASHDRATSHAGGGG